MSATRSITRTARVSVRHGVPGQGVLALLPLVLFGRAVRAARSARAAPPVTHPTPDRTPGVAGHTSGEASGPVEEKARGNRERRHQRRTAARRPPSEMVIPMCTHRPACPSADAPDRDAAKVVVTHPNQGWSLLCNGVVLFDDLGEILPNGGVRGSGAQQVALLRRYGSRRRRPATLPRAA